MPQKPKGGKRQQRQQVKDVDYARELILKEDGEEYGLVIKALGNRMLSVYCLEDKKTRRCHIPKRIKPKIKLGNLVLVTMREFATNDDEADIYFLYNQEEIKQLKEYGHIPEDLEEIYEQQMQSIGEGHKRPAAAQVAESEEKESDVEDIDDI